MAEPGSTDAPASRRRSRIVIASAIAAGIVLGLGGFTFHYAEGLSYFSTDPKACANCHIMRRQYDGWQKASHHGAATCVDCHLPHTFFAKYFAKASNGWHHSKGFTLQDFEEPIRIKSRNSAILQANCLRCHEPMVHDLVSGARTDRDAVECVHCHASVGHGDRAGLGGPPRADERQSAKGTQ
jgi:cytochrome c nitrite reductase small subunit